MDFAQYQNTKAEMLRLERIILSLVSKAARLYDNAGRFASDSEITEYWQLMDQATKYGGEYNALLARLSDFDVSPGG